MHADAVTRSSWTRVAMLAFVSACATEMQEPLPGEPLDVDGSGGSGGSEANVAGGGVGPSKSSAGGTASSGTGGVAHGGGGGVAAGGSGTSGSGGGVSSGGVSSGGVSGGGGKASGGSGGKASGGAGGQASGGSGGKASGGAGGGGSKACGTGKLAITGATASGMQGAGLEAANAVDGNGGTRWSSAVGPTGWLSVDLGQPAHVSRVVIAWEAAYGIDYEIQIAAAEGGPWTTLLHVTNGNGDTDNLTNLTAGNGRYVRMNGNSHALAYGFSIFELEVYGDLDETCQ